MDWALSTWWWVTCGVLVAAELATGTFYLLMLALGAAAAASAAHAGVGFTWQLAIAALVGSLAVILLYRLRRRSPGAAPASRNRDVNLDIGERVDVVAWHDDGSTSVQYRGATWQARWLGPGAPSPGPHVISAIEGNRLLLQR